MKTIFMTGGGGAGAVYATRKLRELNYRVILGDMYRKGYRVCDIAKITGISGQTIQSNVRKLDDFRYVKNPTDWSQHDKAIINQMKKGVIYRKIGEQLGLTRMQVYARVTKLKRIGAIKDIDYRKEGERMVRNVRR